MGGGIGMGMQGEQEVVDEDCEYRRAPEGTVGREGVPVNLITVAFAIAAATRAELDR